MKRGESGKNGNEEESQDRKQQRKKKGNRDSGERKIGLLEGVMFDIINSWRQKRKEEKERIQ